VSAADHRRAVAALVACAAVALGGCAAVSDRAQDMSLKALDPTLPAATATSAKEAPCHDTSVRSLAPSALPRPGHMPAGTFMRKIQDNKKLVVGVDQSSKGLGYFNPITGKIQGFDVDLARAVARAIFGRASSRYIRYFAISTKQRESVIVNDDVDLVASAFSITCARRRKMLFSSVYHRAQQKLLVPENSPVERLSDLRGKKVCATTGSTSLERLRKRQGVLPSTVPLRSDCLVKLQEGEVAAITSDDTILFGFRQQDRRTKVLDACLGIERYGLAINKAHREFVPFVNAVLARLRRDGTLTHLREHWLPRLKPPTTTEIAGCHDNRTPGGPR
jgi:polar amino acid transport system substrate-binding protein